MLEFSYDFKLNKNVTLIRAIALTRVKNKKNKPKNTGVHLISFDRFFVHSAKNNITIWAIKHNYFLPIFSRSCARQVTNSTFTAWAFHIAPLFYVNYITHKLVQSHYRPLQAITCTNFYQNLKKKIMRHFSPIKKGGAENSINLVMAHQGIKDTRFSGVKK